jgi:hypothetical protein
MGVQQQQPTEQEHADSRKTEHESQAYSEASAGALLKRPIYACPMLAEDLVALVESVQPADWQVRASRLKAGLPLNK